MFSGRKVAHKMVHGLTTASVTGALVLLLAASVSAQEASETPAAKQQPEGVKLVVENHNYLDMHIYAVRDGIYQPLGVVTGLSKGEFPIPLFLTRAGADFELLANPIGSEISYLSGPIVFGNAKEIDLTIEANLEFSSATPAYRRFGPLPHSAQMLRWRTRR